MKPFWTSIKTFLWFTLILGGIYPLALAGIGYLFMNHKAQGSIITHQGQIKGSHLIAQKFTRDDYFWPRPSANNYNPLKSGGSNLSPASLALKTIIDKRAGTLPLDKVPRELLFASGSGLDPHISVETAYFQIDRIANSRGVDRTLLEKLIHDLTTYHYVNVLAINIALDEVTKK